VVTGPETKLPKTMKYLRENVEGEDWDFLSQSDIVWSEKRER